MLAVEDDPEYQDLLRAIFASLYDLTVVNAAETAVDKLNKEHFDIVVSDIHLLGMSGLEILKRITRAGLTQDIPVILCSSDTDPAMKKQAMEMGAAGYVTKPFSIEGMLSLVNALLN